MQYVIEPPYYPIVYVRGYAMMKEEREETFYDTYYGFSANSVEKRQIPAPDYFQADLFEGQLIRFMKMKEFGYADATNQGLADFEGNPARSLWVCRFYDQDVFKGKIRSIEEHAEELRKLVCEEIPRKLAAAGVDLNGANWENYRVILLAHSMGGLVCRTLIQNTLPAQNEDPKRWIHRLVTMGTPHRGIDLGRIPNAIEDPLTSIFNPFDAAIFKEPRMREYLSLPENYDVHSLGPLGSKRAFPVKRCFCLIGSDYASYGVVRHVTGNHSDGLVKQNHAYVVAGPPPPEGEDYPDDQACFWANVHRAHSGRRGIVNSYESFENIQRFLFGNIKTEIRLEDIALAPLKEGASCFYDFEFLFSIRKTGVYLHRLQQDPCENAMRIDRNKIPKSLRLHTAFLNSRMKDPGQDFSHFSLKLRVVEHRVREGFQRLFRWDPEYPERPIYNETVEVRVGDTNPEEPGDEVQYRWLSDGEEWHDVKPDTAGVFHIALRSAGTISATLALRAGKWPDPALTLD